MTIRIKGQVVAQYSGMLNEFVPRTDNPVRLVVPAEAGTQDERSTC